MFFRQLSTIDFSLSYVFGCGTAGKAVAVDVVAGDEEWFAAEAAKSSARVTHVVDSHVHADHYSGGAAPRGAGRRRVLPARACAGEIPVSSPARRRRA